MPLHIERDCHRDTNISSSTRFYHVICGRQVRQMLSTWVRGPRRSFQFSYRAILSYISGRQSIEVNGLRVTEDGS
jgi:hypothetical protein